MAEIRRCDQCGIEAPREVRYFLPRERQWFHLSRELRNGTDVCSWECLTAFVLKHKTAPVDLAEEKEKLYQWNADKLQYDKLPPAPPKRKPKR